MNFDDICEITFKSIEGITYEKGLLTNKIQESWMI